MEDWPLTRLCEWNCQLCMCTVVVRMCNCQILTGANIYMVSYPFKIFTSIWLTHCFCNSILFSCFCFDFCSRILSPSVPFCTNPAISPIIRINNEWIGGESSITVYIPNTKWPVLKPKHWVFICNFSFGGILKSSITEPLWILHKKARCTTLNKTWNAHTPLLFYELNVSLFMNMYHIKSMTSNLWNTKSYVLCMDWVKCQVHFTITCQISDVTINYSAVFLYFTCKYFGKLYKMLTWLFFTNSVMAMVDGFNCTITAKWVSQGIPVFL